MCGHGDTGGGGDTLILTLPLLCLNVQMLVNNLLNGEISTKHKMATIYILMSIFTVLLLLNVNVIWIYLVMIY